MADLFVKKDIGYEKLKEAERVNYLADSRK